MDSFVVSARKYRPKTFDLVVGQHAITSTLKNAIRNNQLAQAFLFTGPRGVGKTTCARIFAKTINCEHITENIEACNVCDSCKSFDSSYSFNVHELDAASNNTVDGIRALVDQVRIPPQIGKYKIYIIDEVHMLSQQAFNAFLKTLEEPPAYAKFILATTERHKIIPTILSRCQIFDFARITMADITRQLQYVADKEGITAEYDALHIIARKADGAMRDALSIFDQLVSFSGNSITYKQVIESLNVLDNEYYFRVTDMILEGQVSDILLLINEVLANGFEGSDFITGFGEHLRDLLVSKVPATIKLIEASQEVQQKYREQSLKCPEDFLMQALEINNRADTQYRVSSNKRLTLELALLQITSLVKKKTIAEPTSDKRTLPDATAQVSDKKNTTEDQTVRDSDKSPIKQTQQSDDVRQTIAEQTHGEKPADEAIPPKPASATGITGTAQAGLPAGLSLKIHAKEPARAEETDPEPSDLTEDLPADDISPDLFADTWKKLAEMVKEDSQGLFLAMTKYEPLLNKDGTILVFLDNAIQEDLVEERKLELLSHLRKALNNYALQIETRIRDNGFVQKAYLPKEKFDKLVEKNPLIGELKQTLDLDFDY